MILIGISLVAIFYLILTAATIRKIIRIIGSSDLPRRRIITSLLIFALIFWLMPFYEWIPTVVYHNYLCRTEAGIKIYRSVEEVEGFLADGAWPLDIGYQYSDELRPNDRIVRFLRNTDKSSPRPWVEVPAKDPSLYGYKHKQTRLKLNAVKVQHTIYVIQSGEVLGTLTDFEVFSDDPYSHLGEWRKLLWPFCHACLENNDIKLLKDMILNTLKPAQLTNQGEHHGIE